nr:hypothetical protein [Tanacetum cinerariifolium]
MYQFQMTFWSFNIYLVLLIHEVARPEPNILLRANLGVLQIGIKSKGSPRVDDHEYLMMLEDPYVEVSLQVPPSPDYMPGPEEPEQAPHSPDYIPGPE